MVNYDRLLCLNFSQVRTKLIDVHSMIASPKNAASAFHSHRSANGLRLHALATYRTSSNGKSESRRSNDVHRMMMHEPRYVHNVGVS